MGKKKAIRTGFKDTQMRDIAEKDCKQPIINMVKELKKTMHTGLKREYILGNINYFKRTK